MISRRTDLARQKKRRLFTARAYTAGMVSLFLIFVVLCMVIFTLLTWSSSRADLNMSLTSWEQTRAYTSACCKASDIWTKLLTELSDSSSAEDFYRNCEDFASSDPLITYRATDHCFSLKLPFSETQCLTAEFQALWSADQHKPIWRTVLWKNDTLGDWIPDNHLPVADLSKKELNTYGN